MPDQRRLAAIVVADAVGFSRLMERDELGTFERMRGFRDELAVPTLAAHGGRMIKSTGDGFLAEFGSANAAVQAAVALQGALHQGEVARAADERLRLRIGINLGDVIADGDDVAGDGVNIAARLEPLSPPGGLCISAAVRDQLRHDADLPFADMGELRLKNIARPIRAYALSLESQDGNAGQDATSPFHVSRPVKGFGGKPAIAVLPFDNMSNDPEQTYFADGIAEDILTRLAMWRWIPVIGRNSSFALRGRSVDLKAVGRELGARYVLEGSVRRAGDRVRITGQLIDTETGHHVWAQRYDRVLQDIFALQDEIVDAIVAALEPALGAAERARVAASPPHDMDAWDLCQRAYWSLGQFTRDSLAQAYEAGQAAGRVDPNFATPLAAAAMAKVFTVLNGWDDPRSALPDAQAAAGEALRRNPEEPSALAAHATASALLRHYDVALENARKSVAFNPSYALGRYCLGWNLVLQGQAPAGVDQMQTALRLSPNDPWRPTILASLSSAHFMAGELVEARDVASLVVQLAPAYPMARRALANACGALGELEEGRRQLEAFTALAPGYTASTARQSMPFRDDADFDRYMAGLTGLGWRG